MIRVVVVPPLVLQVAFWGHGKDSPRSSRIVRDTSMKDFPTGFGIPVRYLFDLAPYLVSILDVWETKPLG